MKIFIVATICALLFFAGINYLISGTFNILENGTNNTETLKAITETNKNNLPESFELEIPFIVQAPLSDWSYPFNHNCEEASVLMVNYYIEGISKVDPVKTRTELLALVDFEKKNYGIHEDTTAAQTALLIEDYFGYKTKVLYNIILDDIKKELNSGNLVIVPTNGRKLKNPYFTPPGPLYHMLVIRGYTPSVFITNDPGTKNGSGLRYSYEILEGALNDFGTDKNAMIVIYPDGQI